MSLAVVGRGASYEFRWLRWALLRDTVEVRVPDASGQFATFFAIGDAMQQGTVRLRAEALAEEVAAISASLVDRPFSELVVAPSTASALYLGATSEGPRKLTPREVAQIAPAGSCRDLAEYFSSLTDSIRHVCAHPADDECVLVIDG